MAVDVKLMHIVSDNNLIKGVHRFDFTTAGDWDCVAAVERLPALHYSVDLIRTMPQSALVERHLSGLVCRNTFLTLAIFLPRHNEV